MSTLQGKGITTSREQVNIECIPKNRLSQFWRPCTVNKKGFVFAQLLVTPEPGYR